jgi:hypothetical protein
MMILNYSLLMVILNEKDDSPAKSSQQNWCKAERWTAKCSSFLAAP